MIVFSELTWRAPLLLLEDAIEVTEVIETAVEPNLTDAFGCIHQHSGGIAQAEVNDILRDISARMELEESAEGTRAHTRQRGEIRQTEFIHIVLRDIVLHLQNTAARTSVAVKTSVRLPSSLISVWVRRLSLAEIRMPALPA